VVYGLEAYLYFHARRVPMREADLGRPERLLRLLVFLNSAYFGYAYFMFALGSPHEELFTIFTVGLMYTVCLFSRADVKMACVMVIPIDLGMGAAHLGRGTGQDLITVGLLALATATLLLLTLQQSRQAFEALYLRFLNEELAVALQRKNDEVTRAKHAVEIASLAKSRFFAAASHDLRQPLHALSLLMGSLQAKVKHESALAVLRQMATALDSFESLFRDVLDVARLEGGKVEVRIAAVSSRRLFERLAHEFAALAEAKGLRLAFRGRDVWLESDVALLKRILANLISNAIKYTDRGKVLVACRCAKDQAILQVFDSGIGIAPDELDHVFEDFYQVALAGAARYKQREGVGLGLGIVKRLADLLHHPIEVRSRPGRGSMFALRLPLSHAPHDPEPEGEDPWTRGLSLADRSILVVDDEELVLNAMTALLTDWGANVRTARSRGELQQVLGELSQVPDFLIVDYQMEPSWTGDDAIRLVRETFGSQIPAAIMTGNVSLLPEQTARSGQVHIFEKPVSPPRLRALLRFNLAPPRQRAKAATEP
jgi:signal transduction histidine kinase